MWVFQLYLVMFSMSFMFMGMMFSISFLVQDSWEESNFDNDPFECGFESVSFNMRFPLLISYFTLGVLFLILDLEVIILLPLTGINLPPKLWLAFWFFMVFIILIGTLMEIFYGSLEWKEFV